MFCSNHSLVLLVLIQVIWPTLFIDTILILLTCLTVAFYVVFSILIEYIIEYSVDVPSLISLVTFIITFDIEAFSMTIHLREVSVLSLGWYDSVFVVFLFVDVQPMILGIFLKVTVCDDWNDYIIIGILFTMIFLWYYNLSHSDVLTTYISDNDHCRYILSVSLVVLTDCSHCSLWNFTMMLVRPAIRCWRYVIPFSDHYDSFLLHLGWVFISLLMTFIACHLLTLFSVVPHLMIYDDHFVLCLMHLWWR